MKRTSLLLIFIFTLNIGSIGCKNSGVSSSGLSIVGEIEGARNKPVYFEKTSFNSQNQIVVESKMDDGKLNIQMDENPGPGYYKIRIGRSAVYLVLDGKENKINIHGKYTKFNNNNATITGSELSEKYNSVLNDLKNKKIDIVKVKEIAKESNPILGSVLLVKTFGVRSDFVDIHASVNKNLQEKYPDLYLTKEYTAIIETLRKAKQREDSRAKIKVGMPAPEIAMPGVNGKTHKLSDLKGKIVLIDFWASWCGPCVRSFPELTKTYAKYKNKGFTVFSVSLDGIDKRTAQRRYKTPEDLAAGKENAKKRWLNAISKYNLSWDNHVSDLDKWDCQAAASYGVRSIPKTFLLDKEGNIAAINPRFNLDEAIDKVLTKE